MRKLEKQTKSVDDVEITEMKNKYGSNYGKRSAIKNQSLHKLFYESKFSSPEARCCFKQ